MSCYETVDSQGVITRHYTGGVTMNLTSANTGGAGYVAPSCTDPPPANPLVTEQLASYTIHTSVGSSPASVPEPGTAVLLV